jgi:hypothetical protein
MQRPNGKLISPAAYARLRDLNRSTISRQIEAGVIPAHGGLLDPVEADAGREKNLNGKRHRQAVERKAELAAKASSCPPPAAPVVPVGASGSDAHQAVLATLRTITAPAAVLKFAALALRARCTIMQAFIVAQHFMIAPCLDLDTISADDLIHFPAPLEADWRGLFGKDFNLDKADSEYDLVAAAVSDAK